MGSVVERGARCCVFLRFWSKDTGKSTQALQFIFYEKFHYYGTKKFCPLSGAPIRLNSGGRKPFLVKLVLKLSLDTDCLKKAFQADCVLCIGDASLPVLHNAYGQGRFATSGGEAQGYARSVTCLKGFDHELGVH